jgi:hypothetical protein
MRFLNTVDAELPQAKAVHDILDNYATHKQPKVRAWLDRHPPWTFHFVPASSSWLNVVEGFFTKLTRRGLTSTDLPDLFVRLDQLLARAGSAALADLSPAAPAALPASGKPFRVRPLLSPDNYARRIAEWIRGAERSLWLQYAYITYSSRPVDADFRAVLDHLGELSWRDDFDLRIIVGSNDLDKVRKLAENGFNEARVRVQTNVHNKGIVRDGTQVLVSSQNWSGDGFLRNRDAGLIIEDTEVARYFGDIFEEDWNERARAPFDEAALSAMIAPAGAPPPPGMVRMRWTDFVGED